MFRADAAFGVAVIGGALGCLVLLLKKSISYYVFITSLLGAVVTLVHALGLTGAEANPMPAMVGNLVQLAVTIFLIWYCRWTQGKGWMT